jgi:hypothetical protein
VQKRREEVSSVLVNLGPSQLIRTTVIIEGRLILELMGIAKLYFVTILFLEQVATDHVPVFKFLLICI